MEQNTGLWKEGVEGLIVFFKIGTDQASHKKTNTVGFHSSEVPRIVKFIKTESIVEWWLPGDWGRGKWGLVLMGIEFQFCKMKRVLEIGFTTV